MNLNQYKKNESYVFKIGMFKILCLLKRIIVIDTKSTQQTSWIRKLAISIQN